MVWTAAMAEWGLTTKHIECRSVLTNNTLGLKLTTDNGFCKPEGCPVFVGLSEEQFAKCIARWKMSSSQFDIIGPELVLESDGNTPKLPIRFSKTSGTAVFAYNLRHTNDYTNMIKETRKYVDD